LLRPYLLAELIFGDYTVAMLKEIGEYLVDPGREPRVLLRTAKGIKMRVEFTVAKNISHGDFPRFCEALSHR
jgi:hypothetical protein